MKRSAILALAAFVAASAALSLHAQSRDDARPRDIQRLQEELQNLDAELKGLEGAIAGVVLGGTGAVVGTRGEDVTLPAGSVVRVRLAQPLVLPPQR